MRIRHTLFSICAALAVFAVDVDGALAGNSASSANSDIKVDDAWVRETPLGGSSGGGYVRIMNTGKEADRLIGAQSSAAQSIVLKQTTYVGEALQTRELPGGIEIAPGQSVLMRWEAYHLLFVGLKEPFKRDGEIEALLNFEKAGPITILFKVRPRVHW